MLPSGQIARVNRSEVIGTLAEVSTRRLAQRIADTKLRTINQGTYRPKTILTFREFVETQWQPNLFPTFKESTRRGYSYLLEKYLIPFFGTSGLAEVNRQLVQSFVAQLGQRLAPKSVALAKNLLSKVFTTAMEWNYVSENPAQGVRLPARIAQREPTALTSERVRQLAESLREPYRSMVLIAVLSGLRRGELFALRWSAVDVEQKVLHVRESVYEGHFDTPKTRSSVRTVPIGEALLEIFLRLKPQDVPADALVFSNRKGKPLCPRNILRRVIHGACMRLGLPKVGWHDLRHTSATLLHEREPLRVAQAILGHSDMQTTLQYTHVLPGWQREAMKRLEREVLFPNVPNCA
jgi:integrase